jgi:hypothetical protein
MQRTITHSDGLASNVLRFSGDTLNMPPAKRSPIVSAVTGDFIAELIYRPDEKRTAFAVARDGKISIESEVPAGADEIWVPYSPDNNLIQRRCVVLPDKPEEYGSKSKLIEDIQSYIHRYVELSPLFERIAAHYVLLTWVFDAFNEIPYLRFRGDYGSGKTRALLVLGSIAYRGFFASGASTVSPIFHTLDSFGGTLVLDEADLRFSDKTADLVKILNNGTVRGLPVLRTLQNRNKEFNPAAFSVFGPKLIAMRGSFRDLALESRFLTEDMAKGSLRADIPIQMPDAQALEAQTLRNRLLQFRLMKLASIKPRPETLIAGIDPRLNQMAMPLLSLVEDAELRDQISHYLRARHLELGDGMKSAPEARVLAALRSTFEQSDRTLIPLSKIVEAANASDTGDRVSARDAGHILRSAAIALRKSHGAIVAVRPESTLP